MAVTFGRSFEDFEDEAKTGITRRPKVVSEQIVTDEKGKRRFHGAFTGGFAAGYWNTVGSKEGWEPSMFKSSRENRADQSVQKPEDFMDKEDFGEFGIAPRLVKTRQEYSNSQMKQQEMSAWDRLLIPSSNNSEHPDDASRTDIQSSVNINDSLQNLLQPVSDSFGHQLLKRMGWKIGKGVGANMRTKIITDEAAPEFAKKIELAPEDIILQEFQSKNDTKGLGYTGLMKTDVLDESKNKKSQGYKESKSSKKAIRGQAFGVGAFEEEDEDVYAVDDISQYDYSIGGYDQTKQLGSVDSTFTLAKDRPIIRKQFPAPKLSKGYCPKAILSTPLPIRKREEKVRSIGERAAILLTDKEPAASVLTYLKEADRKRLVKIGQTAKIKSEGLFKNEEGYKDFKPLLFKKDNFQSDVKPDTTSIINPLALPFARDKEKMARFSNYLQCVKSGITMVKPVLLTDMQWEDECFLFDQYIPEDVKQCSLRQQHKETDDRNNAAPLAPQHISRPFAHLLATRFSSAQMSEDYSRRVVEDEDKMQAVKLLMFGAMTRQTFEWHPDRLLCKRMNLPDPFNGMSDIVGVPNMKHKNVQKQASMIGRTGDLASALGMTELSTTETEMKAQVKEVPKQEQKADKLDIKPVLEDDENEDDARPDIDLFKAIFASDDEGLKDTSDSEDEKKKKLPIAKVPAPNPRKSQLSGLAMTLARVVGPSLEEFESNTKMQIDIIQPGATTPPIVETLTNNSELMYMKQEVKTNETNDELFGPSLPPAPPQQDVVKQEMKNENQEIIDDDDDEIMVVSEQVRKKHKHHKHKKEKKKEKRK